MGLHLTGKGSILDAIGGALNTGANAVVSGVKDVGDLGSLGLANLTNNQQAAQNARNAISTNNQNIAGGNLGQNLGGLGLDAGRTALAATQFIPQFAENYSNTFANLGNQLGGGQDQTIQQNMGGTPLLNKTLKISGATGKNKQLASDVAQVGLAAATPAISKAIEPAVTGVVGLAAPRTAVKLATGLSSGLGDATIPTASKIIPRGTGALTAGGVNAGFSGSSYLGNADKPTIKGLAGATGQGLAGGLALGAGGEALGEAASHLKPLNEAGAVGKDVNTPKFNDPEIAKASQNLEQTITNKPTTPPEGKMVDTSSATTSPISGRQVDPQALADMSPADQMAHARANGEDSTFNGPSLKLKSQQPTNKIELTAQTPKAAVGENTYIMSERSRRYNAAINMGSKLSDGDKAKLSDAMNGEDIGKVDNPELFNKTAAALKDAHDYSLAADRLGGGVTPRHNNGNFSPLYHEASPERMDELGIPHDQQYKLEDGRTFYTQGGEDSPLTAGKYKGYRNIERKYSSYTDAANQTKGILRPLNANALEDARMYANRGHSTIEGQLLYKQLKKIAPDEVEQDLNKTVGKNGERLIHAANGQLPFNVSENLNKQLAGYKSSHIDNPIGEAAFKALEVPAKGLRKVAFLGAPIHYVNLTRSFLSTTIPSGHGITAIKGVGEAIAGSLHPKVYEALQKAADENGVREYAGRLGIVDRDTRPNLLGKGTGVKGRVEKYSPFALQMRNLNRFNNVLGWKLAERVKELGVEPGTTKATAIGTEINKVIDRINPKMEGLNPIGERLATSGSLAPHWIRANLGLVKDAVKASFPNLGIDKLKVRGVGDVKTGFGLQSAGDIARTNVIGGRLMVGAVAIVASALATGEMPTLKKALNEAGFNPNNPTPNIDTRSKTKAKYPGAQQYGQVLNTPADPLSMAISLFKDPAHYAIARETPALSAATQAITNKDYFGNPLVDKSQPGWQKKLAVATAEKLEPFSAQNAQNKTLTPGQKAEATLGFRTKTNPNDPNYVKTNQYFAATSAATSGLNKQATQAVDRWTQSTKDPVTGQYDTPPNVNDVRDKAVQLLDNPSAIDAMIARNNKLKSEGQTTDPLWSQPVDKIVSYLQYQAMPPGGPDQVNWRNNNTWYDQGDNNLYQQRQDFFNSLPPGDPNKPAAPIEYPTPSLDVAQAQTQYFNLYKSDPTQAETFLLAHPEVQDQMDKQAAYTNQVRQAEGYAALRTYPKPNAHVQAILDAMPKGTDAASRKARALAYQDPQVAAWSQEDAIYNLTKGAGLAQLQGNSLTSKDLKATQSLQYDIAKNPDGSLSLKYTDPQGGMGATPIQPGAVSINGAGSSGYKKYSSYSKAASQLRGAKMSSRLIKADMQRNRIRLSGRSKPLRGFGLKGQPHQPKYVTLKTPKTGKLRIKSASVA